MGFMAMKLDMSKAYDRVEWRYLGKIMEKLGFCDKWVSCSWVYYHGILFDFG